MLIYYHLDSHAQTVMKFEYKQENIHSRKRISKISCKMSATFSRLQYVNKIYYIHLCDFKKQDDLTEHITMANNTFWKSISIYKKKILRNGCIGLIVFVEKKSVMKHPFQQCMICIRYQQNNAIKWLIMLNGNCKFSRVPQGLQAGMSASGV